MASASDTAMVSAMTTHTTHSTHTVRRKWVQRERTVLPFVWRGLLPALGLGLLACYALWPFAQDDIEHQVSVHTRAGLDAAGQGWAKMAVSGQNVVLSGTPPAAGAGEAALATARAAVCPSWLGAKTCAVQVSGEFASPAVISSVAAAPAAAPAPTSASAVVQAAQACEDALGTLVGQSTIVFATASAVIDASSAALLDKLGQAAARCPGVIQVEGHTDARGSAALNQRLSQARAEAVREALMARGLSAQRLKAQGFGAEQPVADNNDEAGRARNRRIAFKVLTGQP